MIPTLSEALAERGYDTLTPVQEAVTDSALEGADLLVSAQTGSGKTVGFGLAIAHTLLGEDAQFGRADLPMALIVAPTRELALQVMRELEWLYSKARARVVSCIGGMDARTERRNLERGAHIVVGTPGRLRDHIERGALDLGGIRAIVLDEADEMLDLGFREDLEYMLGEAPAERRTLLFSATVPPAIEKMAQKFQTNAKRVSTLTERKQHSDIAYQAILVAPHDAESAVINLLRYHDAPNTIVFANTRASVNRLTARLSNRGLSVVCLSGELSQQERSHALQSMRDGRARVCVATDVAARGIDLPNLDLVVHAELPQSTEALLHRSGRTGRAGRKGISALVVTPREAKKGERLLKWAKVSAEWVEAPTVEQILTRDEERLLADPVWKEEISDEARAFAARLIEAHDPERIAAACFSMYRAGLSAPEEIGTPDVRSKMVDRKPFVGPWFSLSVGRKDGAEPRWLLPLLCRAGGLDREDIGMIRMQQTETWVQISEGSAAEFETRLGKDGVLEKDVNVSRMEKAPDVSQLAKPPAGGKRFDKGPRGDKFDKGPRKGKFDRDDKPDRNRGPRKPRDDAWSGAPKGEDRGAAEEIYGGKPQGAGPKKPRDGEGYKGKPRRDGDGEKRSFGKGPKPAGAKGAEAKFRKPGAKSFGDKPAGKGPKAARGGEDRPVRRSKD